jgi:CHAT domain-containing protein/Tfp pilus assembly protein PilF
MYGQFVHRLIVKNRTWLSLFVVLWLAGSEAGAAAFNLPGISRVAAKQSSAVEIAEKARELAGKRQFEQAIQLSQQALKVAEQQFGPEDEHVAFILDDLAKWHYRLREVTCEAHGMGGGVNSLEEALSYSTRALAIIGNSYSVNSLPYASLANTQGSVLFGLGRLEEAERLYGRAHDTVVNLPHPLAVTTARNLGIIYRDMSEYDKSATFFEQALAGNRRLHGNDSVAVAKATLDLADMKLRQEATAEATELAIGARQVLATQVPVDLCDLASADVIIARVAIRESRLGDAEKRLRDAQKRLRDAGKETSLAGAAVLDSIGFIYVLRGQATEAEPIYKEVLEIRETVVGQTHPAIAQTFHSLAIVYKNLGQYGDAERFYKKAIEIFTKSFGPINASVAATRLERVLLLTERGASDEAIEEARAALSVYEKLKGPWEIKQGYALSALGFAQHRAAKLDTAAASFNRALQLMANVRGDQSSDLPPGLTELGEIYLRQGRLADAEASVSRAIAILEKDQAVTPHGLAKSLSTLARAQMKQGRLREALATAQRYVNVMRDRLDVLQRSLSAAALGENLNSRRLFEEFLEIVYSNLKEPDSDLNKLNAQMFEVAQFPQITDTAAALTRMAARFAPRQTELAPLVRQRQDAVEQWRAVDRMLTEHLSGKTSLPGKRELELRREHKKLTEEIEGLDEALRQKFPNYTELTNPRPVSLQTAQKLLKPEEALLLQLTGDTGTFVFLVRQNDVKLAHTDMNKIDLHRYVASLRNGLVAHRPPFDTTAAHYLYQNLIRPFEGNLNGIRNIIAVVDGAMQTLPLSVLLASPAAPPESSSNFQQLDLDFLARHYALSVVPSVSSLEALRSVVKPSKSKEPFVGFGDPDLKGPTSGASEIPADVVNKSIASIDLQALRLKPLPATRNELTALAESLEASENSLFFGEKATESAVKNTDLSRYRIIAFATHGLLAGESGLAEPALVLTPSNREPEIDDGLLTATEIANLKLDADWVILSACNTAGPEGRPGAEGLSGLAKAFFYAGSRALMVSHWQVESDATVLLTTKAIQEFSKDPAIGRAEALRRAMQVLMKGESKSDYAHPYFWAPFVIVGEGGKG